MRRKLGAEIDREPRIYILAFPAEADSVLSGWLKLEVDAPSDVELATYEWSGHGVRQNEPLLSNLDEVGADAFETFREAMIAGPFIAVGNSVGVLVMLYVCERAQRELGVAPRSAFALDRGPPHMPVFTDFGYQLLVDKPTEWMALWNPGISRLHRDGKIADAAFKRWIADMRIENDIRPVGWYRFACRMTVLVALKTSQDFPPAACIQEGVDEVWADKISRCTRSGKGYSWEPEDFDLWREWADDVCIYELPCEHEQVSRDSAFHDVLWQEVRRVIG